MIILSFPSGTPNRIKLEQINETRTAIDDDTTGTMVKHRNESTHSTQ